MNISWTPDGDALSFSASAEYPGVLTARIVAIGIGPGTDLDTLNVEAINPGSSTVTYGSHDGYGGFVSRTITITVTASERRSVGDKSPAGTLVGDPVTGTSFGEEPPTFTYALTGEAADSGAFVIDSATGQISVGGRRHLELRHQELLHGPGELHRAGPAGRG